MADEGTGTTPGGGWVPVPDPTALTTDAVARATDTYRRELTHLRELIETRLDCMDSAAQVHVEAMGHLRQQLEEKIIHLEDLHKEKFDGIDRRFEDRDARGREGQASAEKALAAALQSAKELTELQNRANKELAEQQDKANQAAITKAQASTTEQIKSLETVTATDRQALRDLIEDTRTRLTTIESLTRGIQETKTERRLDTGQIVAMISVLFLVISVAVTILIATR